MRLKLASSSLPKREVWKCFKSSLHTTSQVFARNYTKCSRKRMNHFRSAVFLQNSEVPAVPREKLKLHCRKYLRTEVRKVWRKCGFFLFDLAHSFMTNAKQDKMFVFSLTLMLYCTSKIIMQNSGCQSGN